MEDKLDINKIKEYVYREFKHISNKAQAIRSLERMISFLDSKEFMIDPDIIAQLINEVDEFRNTISIIISEEYENILNGNIYNVIKNEMVISFIETYCLINNIEISSPDFDESYVSYDDESVDEIDIVRIFLNDIGRIPLLTPEEEKDLFIQIANGDTKAKNKLIESHLRWVVTVARRYQGQGLAFLELVQEGTLGLMKAIDHFDTNKKCKLTTYATWWIRQTISRALSDQGRNIRLPVHWHEEITRYDRTVKKMSQVLKREPSIKEIAKELGISEEKAISLYNYHFDTTSLSTPIGEENDAELEDFIVDDDKLPEDYLIEKDYKEKIKFVLENSGLTEKQVSVLKQRFFQNKTLEATGREMHITRERVRQIEGQALRKIRRSSQLKLITGYSQSPEAADFLYERYHKDEVFNNVKKYHDYIRELGNGVCYIKVRSPYEILSAYSNIVINQGIMSLSAEDRGFLGYIYENNFGTSSKIFMSDRQFDVFCRIINTIRIHIMGNNITNDNLTQDNSNTTIISKTIYDLVPYPEEDINVALRKIESDDISFLYRIYKNNLKVADNISLKDEEMTRLLAIVDVLTNLVKGKTLKKKLIVR